MKKVFGQTVRDIKREVNKTVLKVPRIEQKVLDATSNEPWGPHGSLLAEIAHASRNYHDYQMIMSVIWKRLNDSGKNWRHVYKGLTVLEYLVAHGSERVLDEIKEHAYQLSSLSSFQYIDSSGRDQGANVRKKSQSLGVLVNDEERINEVRQKAAANRDKFQGPSSTGGMYRPSSNSNAGGYGDRYDDDGRYGSRDEDRNGNGYGREREYDYGDDDRYGRNGDSNRRDGDQYSKDNEERHRRGTSRDSDNWGRRSVDDDAYGSRRDQDRDHDDNARDGGGRVDDQSRDVRQHDRKFSEQDIGAPPSYEEAVNEPRSPSHSERDRVTSTSAPTGSSPPATSAPSQISPVLDTSTSANQITETFDEFDPRSSVTAAPTISNSVEMDLLGSLSDFPSNQLAIMPEASADVTGAFEPDSLVNSGLGTSYTTASVSNNQTFEDPFGDTPFKAITSNDGAPPQSHSFATMDPLQSSVHQILGQSQGAVPETNTISNFEFGDTFSAPTYASSVSPSDLQSIPHVSSTPDSEIDILADILPPSGPSSNIASQPTYSFPGDQPALPTFSDPNQLTQQSFTAVSSQPSESNVSAFSNLHPQSGANALVTSNIAFQPQSVPNAQFGYGMTPPQGGSTTPFYSQLASTTGSNAQVHSGGYFIQNGGSAAPATSQLALQNPNGPAAPFSSGDIQHHGYTAPVGSQVAYQVQNGPAAQPESDILGSILPQAAPNTQIASQAFPTSTGSLMVVSQPSKGKFETKSTVWADTLNRGLVDLNISGPKTNPLADIGVDFDAINRRDKRMEKQPTTTTVTSTITMGKAMGSGSGVGRAGATALRAAPNPMMGSGMGIGVGVAPGGGMGAYGGINQPMGMGTNTGMNPGMGMGMGMNPAMGMGMNPAMGMGMGMNPAMGMGMGMNPAMGMHMGMGQGMQFQPPAGFPPGSNFNASGSYNPMMGNYNPQQSYGGRYQ